MKHCKLKSALIIHHSIRLTFVVLNDLICNINLVSNKFYKYLTPVTTVVSEAVGAAVWVSISWLLSAPKRVSKERMSRACKNVNKAVAFNWSKAIGRQMQTCQAVIGTMQINMIMGSVTFFMCN